MIETTTFDELQTPPVPRAVNWVGNVLERVGVQPLRLKESALRRAAENKTGLSDWGEEEFDDGFSLLIDEVNRDPRYHMIGRIGIQQTFMMALTNRLRIQETLKRYPEIRDLPVKRPIFIIGFPRTGTTVLHNLLAQDPNRRAPLLWEMWRPCPAPIGQSNSERIAEVRKAMDQLYGMVPQFRCVHAMEPEWPEECIFLIRNSLDTELNDTAWDTPQYRAWLDTRDGRYPYRYYRQQLQIMQWRMPERSWVLKTPYHLFHLDALLDVFPDACIVHTHRDPLKVAGSFCSLTAIVRAMVIKHVDPVSVGDYWIDIWGKAIDRTLAVRRQADPARFFDLHYGDLVADPGAAIKRIYEHFDLPHSPDMETRIQGWLGSNPQHKYGRHRYSLERFGLTAERINERFAEYTKQFDIPNESN